MNPIFISLAILFASGSHGMSRSGALRTAELTEDRIYAEFGVRFQIKAIRQAPTPSICYKLSESSRGNCLDFWAKWFSDRRANPNAMKLNLLPPLQENGIWYAAGMASNVCNMRGIAVCNVMSLNAAGQPRDLMSLYACVHELAHLLGCDHISGFNVMDPAALRFIADGATYLPFTDACKSAVMWCVLRKSRNVSANRN